MMPRDWLGKASPKGPICVNWDVNQSINTHIQPVGQATLLAWLTKNC